MDNYDVVVVGAGLAGLQTARCLAEQRLRVLLVDRKRQVDCQVRTTGIFVRRTMDDFALPCEHLGPAIRHVTLYSPKRRRLDLESPHVEFRIGDMAALYRVLLQQAIDAGVVYGAETSFLASDPEGDGSRIWLVRRGGRCQVYARFIIGSDGVNSRVARDLELSRNRRWIIGLEEVYTNVSLHGAPRLHCFVDPCLAPGYIAWIAHDGEEAHLGLGGYAQRLAPRAALDAFRTEWSRWIDLDDADFRERRGGRIPVGGILPRIVCPRGLLLGDAAGAASPLTGGGLDPCLRQAMLAAEIVVEYLRTCDQDVLARYDGRLFRNRFFLRRMLRHGLSIVRQRWVAELACTVLRTAPFRPLVRQVFFGRGSFPLERSETATINSSPNPTTMLAR